MNNMIKILLASLFLFSIASISHAGVSGESLINVQDPTATGTLIQGVRVKDASLMTGDAVTSGILANGGLLFNGTNWDRMPGDKTNGVYVNIKSGGITGTVTPADTFSNPTNATSTWSLNGVFNGTTWDRVRSGINTGQILTDNSSNAANNITTNATTAVKATGGVLNAVIINTAGTTSTAAFYNIASAGCTGTPASGYQFTIGTAALAIDSQINHTFPLGICVVTAGGAAANISILYR